MLWLVSRQPDSYRVGTVVRSEIRNFMLQEKILIKAFYIIN
jgi:hypothetical protein